MFCKHCGKELADSAFMCPECGTPTSNMYPTTNQKSASKNGETIVDAVNTETSPFPLISIITGAIAFFLTIFFIVLLEDRIYYASTPAVVLGLFIAACVLISLIMGVWAIYKTRKSQPALSIAALIVSCVSMSFFVLYLIAGVF